MTRSAAALLLVLAAAGCSPAYVYQAAAGHAGLLWRRRRISETIADPATPPELRRKLELALAARRFAFDTLHLTRQSVYAYWTPVPGRAVTWLAEASARTELKPHLFRFPLIGAFPYKGYFRRDAARAEAARLESRGLDATVVGAGAYRTPLPIADPLPETLLRDDDGELAQTLIHELTHGTVYFRNQSDFDEAVAVWVGARGAEAFLLSRGGPDSPEMKQWRDDEARERAYDEFYARLDGDLAALYALKIPDAEKLSRRAAIFDSARARAKAAGLRVPETLNNAVVLAQELYAPDFAPFDALFAAEGRDWARTIAALKSLNRRDPFGDLRSRTSHDAARR